MRRNSLTSVYAAVRQFHERMHKCNVLLKLKIAINAFNGVKLTLPYKKRMSRPGYQGISISQNQKRITDIFLVSAKSAAYKLGKASFQKITAARILYDNAEMQLT